MVAVFRSSDLTLMPPGVKDSKKVSEFQRSTLFWTLCNVAYDIGIGHAWPWEIDQYKPYPALQLSYSRAIGELLPERRPQLLYVDGNNKVESWKGQQIVEPKGDSKFIEVSAASIIAKVFRDTIMADYCRTVPGVAQYEWKSNKGYGTAAHEAAIRKYGVLIDPNNKSRYFHRLCYCKKFVRSLNEATNP